MTVPARRPVDDALDRLDALVVYEAAKDALATVREALERQRDDNGGLVQVMDGMARESDLEHQSERRAYWRKRAEAAEAEVRQLREDKVKLHDWGSYWKREARRLAEGLREYGHHKQGCNQLKSPGLGRSPEFSGQECDCGLAALLSANPTQGDAEGSSPTDGGGA